MKLPIMKRTRTLRSALFAGVLSALASQVAVAVDGTWTLVTAGNQDFLNTANWLNGILPDGIDSSAVFNVNLTKR
jgi:hypothetical protein